MNMFLFQKLFSNYSQTCVQRLAFGLPIIVRCLHLVVILAEYYCLITVKPKVCTETNVGNPKSGRCLEAVISTNFSWTSFSNHSQMCTRTTLGTTEKCLFSRSGFLYTQILSDPAITSYIKSSVNSR
jgi:hypothetical protein